MQRFPFYSIILVICIFVQSPAARAQTTIDPGRVEIDISDLLGRPLHARVEFLDHRNEPVRTVELPNGVGETRLQAGNYDAHVSVVHLGALFLVATKSIEVSAGQTEYLLVSLSEGSGKLPLEQFDRDHDLAIDRVELENETDPNDPSSIPGHQRLDWSSPILSAGAGWFVGDLHTFSRHSIGSESPSKLIARAEKDGLDFLAITDRNTLAHTQDNGFRSDKVVLIPAMEWGSDATGYAIILRPGTVPKPAHNEFEAQSVLDRAVQQEGVFAPAHPCFPTTPWLRTIGYFNAVEIWCRDWRIVPPLAPDRLPSNLRVRSDGEYIFPIARAVQTPMQSANGQADYFWRFNLNAGRKSAAIGGSHSASPKVALGSPLTHVYAENKSLDAIIRGIRFGRTIVSRDKNAPRLEFMADALNDGRIETQIGGIVPLRQETKFISRVFGGDGKRLEILLNGKPIRTVDVVGDRFEFGFLDTPQYFSNYIARITDVPSDEGFGFRDMLVTTSPIYAQEIVFVDEQTGRSSWVRVESAPEVPEELVGSPPDMPSRPDSN